MLTLYTSVSEYLITACAVALNRAIGTPHTYHYLNAMDAIKAKKHVLCEKPVTCNSFELKALIAAAKEHGVFFMEAVWTRFHPLSLEVKRITDSGVLGAPVVLTADLSGDFGINSECSMSILADLYRCSRLALDTPDTRPRAWRWSFAGPVSRRYCLFL